MVRHERKKLNEIKTVPQARRPKGIKSPTSHLCTISIWMDFSLVPQEQHITCTLFKYRFNLWTMVETTFKWCLHSLLALCTERASTIPHTCPYKRVPYFSLNSVELWKLHQSSEISCNSALQHLLLVLFIKNCKLHYRPLNSYLLTA